MGRGLGHRSRVIDRELPISMGAVEFILLIISAVFACHPGL